MFGGLATAIVIFAVDDLGLLRVELQLASSKAPLQRRLEVFGLVQAPTVAQPIIGIALEGTVRVVALHPSLEGVMQEEVRQQWRGDSTLRRAAVSLLQGPVRPLYRCL